jgi:hypothetical protein
MREAGVQSSQAAPLAVIIGFAAGIPAFIGLWFAVTAILGLLSGWFTLQRRYPSSDEQRLLTFYAESGSVGIVEYRGCLVLSACRSGLRVGAWRIMAPLERHFTVPWADIRSQRVAGFFGAKAQLSFGDARGSLRIKAATWEALVGCAKARPPYD